MRPEPRYRSWREFPRPCSRSASRRATNHRLSDFDRIINDDNNAGLISSRFSGRIVHRLSVRHIDCALISAHENAPQHNLAPRVSSPFLLAALGGVFRGRRTMSRAGRRRRARRRVELAARPAGRSTSARHSAPRRHTLGASINALPLVADAAGRPKQPPGAASWPSSAFTQAGATLSPRPSSSLRARAWPTRFHAPATSAARLGASGVRVSPQRDDDDAGRGRGGGRRFNRLSPPVADARPGKLSQDIRASRFQVGPRDVAPSVARPRQARST